MAVYDSESARHPDYLCRRNAIGNWNFHRTHSGTPVKSVPCFDFGDQMSRDRLRLTARRTGRHADLAGTPVGLVRQLGLRRPGGQGTPAPLAGRPPPTSIAADRKPAAQFLRSCHHIYIMRQFATFVDANFQKSLTIRQLPIRQGKTPEFFLLGVHPETDGCIPQAESPICCRADRASSPGPLSKASD